MDFRIRDVQSGADVNETKALFKAYADSLGISLCFQNFKQELSGLPGAYAQAHLTAGRPDVTALSYRPSSYRATMPSVDVSVLVPAKDEEGNLPLFLELCEATFNAQRERYEVIVIDDGSRDNSWLVLQQLAERYAFLRPVRHRAQRGIAEALRTGYLNARGDILVFYPADLQFKPEDIPRLVAPIVANESDMVTGYKQGKYEKAFV